MNLSIFQGSSPYLCLLISHILSISTNNTIISYDSKSMSGTNKLIRVSWQGGHYDDYVYFDTWTCGDENN